MNEPAETEILQILQRLESRIEEIAEKFAMDRAGCGPMPREFISLEQAARLCGRSKQGVTNWLKRERGRVDGFAVRRIRGGVHRADFEAFMEIKTKRGGRGAAVRAAVDEIFGG